MAHRTKLWLGSLRLFSLSYVFKHPWPEGGEVNYAFSLRFLHLLGHTHSGFIALVPNLGFYPLILLGFSTVFGVPWVTLVGLIAAVWRWRLPEAKFTLLLAVLTVVFYMPNFEQDPRYLAGPCFLLTAWAAAAFVKIARTVRDRHGRQIAQFLAPGPAKAVAQNTPS